MIFSESNRISKHRLSMLMNGIATPNNSDLVGLLTEVYYLLRLVQELDAVIREQRNQINRLDSMNKKDRL